MTLLGKHVEDEMNLELAVEDVQTPRAKRTFSFVQMVLMVLTVGPMSGLGGAWTATATDDKQDTAIEAAASQIVALKGEIKGLGVKLDAADVAAERRVDAVELTVSALGGEIATLGAKVDAANDAAEKRVDDFKEDVRGDIGEIRALIIQQMRDQARANRGKGGP